MNKKLFTVYLETALGKRERKKRRMAIAKLFALNGNAKMTRKAIAKLSAPYANPKSNNK